jgi:hypothetical protein
LDIIEGILAHIRDKGQDIPALPLLTPRPRAPPEKLLLFLGYKSAFTEFNQQGSHCKTAWHGFLHAPVREWPE